MTTEGIPSTVTTVACSIGTSAIRLSINPSAASCVATALNASRLLNCVGEHIHDGIET